MKKEPKGCSPDNHDFMQINNYALTAHTLSQIGPLAQMGVAKPPQLVCRKCGKVITV